MGITILVKYPADLDVTSGDYVNLAGMFSAHEITFENRGLSRTKQKEIINALCELFVGAATREAEV